VLVQECRDAGGVGADAVTLDAAEKLPMRSGPVGILLSLSLTVAVDMASGILRDLDDVGDRSRHGSSLEWCSYGPMKTTGARSQGCCQQVIAGVEVAGCAG